MTTDTRDQALRGRGPARALPGRTAAAAVALGAMLLSAPAGSQPSAPLPPDGAAPDEHGSSLVVGDGVLKAQDTIVSFGNVILFNFREADATSITSPIVAGGMVTGAVIEVDSGGAACPATYAIVDRVAGKWFVSDEFGSCSDQPRLVYNGGTLFIEIPDFGGAKAQAWSYAAGNLQRIR